jgi:hypothetical protein
MRSSWASVSSWSSSRLMLIDRWFLLTLGTRELKKNWSYMSKKRKKWRRISKGKIGKSMI